MNAWKRIVVSIIAGFVLMTNAAATGLGNLVNLSLRTKSNVGARTPIVGFVLPVPDDSHTMSVLVRGMGPSLSKFGVADVMQHPSLALYNGQTVIASNSSWMTDASNLKDAASSVGAFQFTDGLPDAAISKMLAGGLYTCLASPTDGVDGIVLVELYRGNDGWNGGRGGFMNGSFRATTGPGASVFIMGFVISYDSAEVLLRAVGPGLGKVGVQNTPNGVTITLIQNYQGANWALIPDGKGSWVWKLASTLKPGEVTNDGWSSTSANQSAVTTAGIRTGAFPLDSGSGDSAIDVMLAPGNYSLKIESKDPNPDNDIVLGEIYAVTKPLPPSFGP